MTEFTPFSALAGGLLIGLAVALLYFGSGRLGGISGILELAIARPARQTVWSLYFVAGLILAGVLGFWLPVGDRLLPDGLADWEWILAGALVGFGARISGGCTSGHGVCGLARLNPRSAFATVLFMVAGGVTVYVLRHTGAWL